MCSNLFNNYIILLVFIIISLTSNVTCNMWCYSCVSTQPGCTLDEVNWWIHSAINCPRKDDKCVKIIDRRGSDLMVTRDCLSNVISFRRDIPADRYEGCRESAQQPKLAVYVENSVSELDLKRDYYDETTYCFCEFDEWCNHSTKTTQNSALMLSIAFISALVSYLISNQI